MESNAIEKAYGMYAGEAYLYSLSLCKNPSVAEDIVSEAFVKALLSISVQEDYFKLWLLRVCKTTWLDLCRRNRYAADVSIDETIDIRSRDDVLRDVIKREESDALMSAVLSLPGTYREAVTLFYLNGVSQQEIARLLNLSYGAVRTLIYRGRKLLAEKLKEVQDGF